MKNPTDHNRPLRIFEKALGGGLGAGNLGVVVSPPGTGKVAVVTSIAVDRAMNDRHVLHIALGKSVGGIRAYRDEVLAEIEMSLDLTDRDGWLTRVERHTQIYTYRDGTFSVDRLRHTLDFLAEHAEFRPDLIELQHWPDFHTVPLEEIRALKALAEERRCEIWSTPHAPPDETRDARGMPISLARFDPYISVVVALEPHAEHTNVRFVKVHGHAPATAVHLEFDPATMLLRWR